MQLQPKALAVNAKPAEAAAGAAVTAYLVPVSVADSYKLMAQWAIASVAPALMAPTGSQLLPVG